MMTYREVFNITEKEFKKAGIEESCIDVRYLMEFVCHCSWSYLLIQMDKMMSENEYKIFEKLAEMRKKHMPLQYIIGEQEFMGLPFYVTPVVLIPRQDTEILVECVIKDCKNEVKKQKILDLCTGSGCIIISLAKYCELENAMGSDISCSAIEIAKKNAERNGVSVQMVRSDLFDKIKGKFNIITANPPYIETNEIPTLMPEVSKYEPELALDGGEDGLVFYRRIVAEAADYLENRGRLYMEIGCTQASQLIDMLMEHGYSSVNVIKDYSGLDRVICAVK